jgi:hypothetical protein
MEVDRKGWEYAGFRHRDIASGTAGPTSLAPNSAIRVSQQRSTGCAPWIIKSNTESPRGEAAWSDQTRSLKESLDHDTWSRT